MVEPDLNRAGLARHRELLSQVFCRITVRRHGAHDQRQTALAPDNRSVGFQVEVKALDDVDPSSFSAHPAGIAKTQPKQEAAQRSELDEVALVVESVSQAMVVEGFRDYCRNSLGGNVTGKRTDICTHVGICGAEIGEEGVAEHVLASAFRVGFSERVVVKKDCPTSGAKGSSGRLATQIGQDIRLCGQPAHARLKAELGISPRVGPEEDRAPIQKTHLPRRVVGKNVSAVVVRGCNRDAARPRPTRNVFENAADSLVQQIGGEGEERGLDRRYQRELKMVPAVDKVASLT